MMPASQTDFLTDAVLQSSKDRAWVKVGTVDSTGVA
jgi:hypothetical protein